MLLKPGAMPQSTIAVDPIFSTRVFKVKGSSGKKEISMMSLPHLILFFKAEKPIAPGRALIIKSLAKYPDLIINALPGAIGFSALKNSIKCGKDIIDISFFPEDPFTLKTLVEKMGSTAIVDCGIAPGFSNMIAGFHYPRMRMGSFCCYVGGLPKNKKPPFNYKAPFSPADVIEEYTRPARYMNLGQVVTKPALSDVEDIFFENVGELEAFNT